MSWEQWMDVMRGGDMTHIHNHFTATNANRRVEYGRTPLHTACGGGTPDNADVVAHLLDCGADIQNRDSSGCTALHYAALNKKRYCLRMLVSTGAVVDYKGSGGWTALAWAIRNRDIECGKLLLDWGAQLSEAHADVTVPEWAPAYVAGRERTRVVAIILLGSRRKQLSSVLASNAMDVIRLIAKEVWSTRGDEAWQKDVTLACKQQSDF